MSAFSTIDITVADARKRLMVMLLEAGNEQLEDMMNAIGTDALLRFRIVDEYDEANEHYTGQV